MYPSSCIPPKSLMFQSEIPYSIYSSLDMTGLDLKLVLPSQPDKVHQGRRLAKAPFVVILCFCLVQIRYCERRMRAWSRQIWHAIQFTISFLPLFMFIFVFFFFSCPMFFVLPGKSSFPRSLPQPSLVSTVGLAPFLI